MQRQAVREGAEMVSVHRNPVLRVFGGNRDLERLVCLDWIAAVTFFSPEDLVFHVVPDDRIFLRPDTQMEHHIVSRLQGRSPLEVDLAAEKNFLISRCKLLSLINVLVNHRE